MRRRNEARTTLRFFFTNGCDTHLWRHFSLKLLQLWQWGCVCVCVQYVCERTRSSVQKAGWLNSRCWRTTESYSKTGWPGHCGDTTVRFTSQKNQTKTTDMWENVSVINPGPPDFEEVVERGVAIAAQSIFIFQVLKQRKNNSWTYIK